MQNRRKASTTETYQEAEDVSKEGVALAVHIARGRLWTSALPAVVRQRAKLRVRTHRGSMDVSGLS